MNLTAVRRITIGDYEVVEIRTMALKFNWINKYG